MLHPARFLLKTAILERETFVSMPYLQFDLPGEYAPAVKRRLAERVGRLYSEVMQTSANIVKVAFRELGPDNLYRCHDSQAPHAVVVIMCDIRRGRPAAQRQELATVLVAACADELELPVDRIELEFTQHPGDEMYRRGALVADWEPGEARPVTP
jgi:phenylpyruvate tautomerase PptA (4-oxalocrotonate tautomerase family)